MLFVALQACWRAQQVGLGLHSKLQAAYEIHLLDCALDKKGVKKGWGHCSSVLCPLAGMRSRWGLAHSTNDLHAIVLTADAFLLPDSLPLSFRHRS